MPACPGTPRKTEQLRLERKLRDGILVNGESPHPGFINLSGGFDMSKITRRRMISSSLAITALGYKSNAQSQPKLSEFKTLSSKISKSPANVTSQTFAKLSKESLDAQIERLATLGITPGSADDINVPWEMLLNKLGAYVSGSDPKNVQLVTDPRAATWDDSKYGPYRLCKLLGDSMPKWGATYEPAIGNSFGDEYGIFLGNIQIPPTDPADDKKVEKARSEWQTSLTAVQTRKSTVCACPLG